MTTTDRSGLKRMGPGEHLSDDGYQFVDADRALIDRLLYLGAESHRHDGAVAVAAATPASPSLSLNNYGGAVPAGTRLYYKTSLVDANGLESAGSLEAFIDTPAPVSEPAAPTLTISTFGGTLGPGNYNYVLSAYTTGNTQETKALSPAFKTVPVGTTTNRIVVGFPTAPVGTSGWNIYRKRPGGARYDYLTSVTVAAVQFIDTGELAEDCNRTLPVRNSTNGQGSVQITMGTTVPVGSTWKVYRSYISGSFSNSLLWHVVEETAEGSGIITPVYVDTGLATRAGMPPVVGVAVASPSRIRLGDATDVEGALPMAKVSAFPEVVVFSFEGFLSARQGTTVWPCEYPGATVMGVRAVLGRGYSPAATDVVVDVNCGTVAFPGEPMVYASIFAAAADQPRILVGEQVGARVVPTAKRELSTGDLLSVDIDTAGGGGAPTDADLIVSVYLLVHSYTSPLSHVPEPI